MTRLASKAVSAILVLALAACTSSGPTKKEQKAKKMKQAAVANTQLGIAYMREGELDISLKKFEKALEQDPDLVTAHDGIAVLYGRLDEGALAEKHFEKALRLNPDGSQTHNNYGLFLCQQGKYIAAEEHFNAAASNPVYRSIPAAYTNAGICARRIPDMEKAEEYFRRALEVDPEYAPALMHMMGMKYSQNNYMSARGYLQRYEQVARHNAESLWLAVRVETALGDYDASASYAMQLRNNFPDTTQAKNLQEWENERRNQR